MLRSELGLAVCAFALLRIIAVVHHPAAFPDTAGYLRFSLVGGAKRLWTVPLVWNLFPSNDLREAAQLAIGIAAWSALAAAVSDLIGDLWLRRAGIVAVLAVGLVPQVTAWDSTLLSESLSASLLVLLIASLIRLRTRPSRGLALSCLACTTLWVFARDVNVVVFASLLPFVAAFLLWRGPLRLQGLTVLTLLAIAAWGLFAISQPSANPVWHQNALEIVENRLAPDPAALAFLYSRTDCPTRR